MILLSVNNANTTLGANLTSGATTIVLASGTGALFPSPASNEYFTLTLNDALTGLLYEVCWCTARTGDSLTVLRGQEGTSARAWLIGDYAYNTETAGSISTARAYSSINNPFPPYTIPPEHNGVTQIISSAGTITLPNPSLIADGYLCPIVVYTNISVTINVNGAEVSLPTGIVTSTFTMSGNQNFLTLQWRQASSAWFLVSGAPGFFNIVTGFSNIAYVTATGTWTVPAYITRLRITVIGGGGGGGGSSATGWGGGGGGGGAVCTFFSSVTAGAVLSVTVGAAGTGGAQSVNGTAGAATLFQGVVVNGGGGGVAAVSNGYGNGGSGGTLGSGATNGNVGGGGQGGKLTEYLGGVVAVGGDGGANGIGWPGGIGNIAGGAIGANYGSGGAGGAGTNGGGNGADGVVIIEY